MIERADGRTGISFILSVEIVNVVSVFICLELLGSPNYGCSSHLLCVFFNNIAF